MKPIAIHSDDRRLEWSEKWISYCKKEGIPFRTVNCKNSDIIAQLRGCSALLYIVSQQDPTDMLMFRIITNSVERLGLCVWPDHATNWHFDNKLAQKYLFESLDLPAVPAWAFYSKSEAYKFLETCNYPIVGKQLRGAGSVNVHLLKDKRHAKKYVRRMFGKGFPALPPPWVDMGVKLKASAKSGGTKGILGKLKRAPRYLMTVLKNQFLGHRDKGYVYLQKYLPGNDHDIRITVIGNRAWGFRRIVRRGDFRASGSGSIEYDSVPEELIPLSFEIADKLGMQSVGIDWLKARDGKYQFVEVSMAFLDSAVHECSGYWDKKMGWHDGHFSAAEAVLQDVISEIKK